MLQIKKFTFNPFQENTYVIYNENGDAWLIDPGMERPEETQALVNFLQEHALSPQGIINTHAHIDHILGINAIQNRYPGLSFSLHELEQPVLENATQSAQRFGFSFDPIQTPEHFLETGLLQLGAEDLEIRLVPGHSPGSIAFYYPAGNWVVSGDALFKGSIGRTDLPFCDPEALPINIHTQLYTLPLNTVVYPGHGPATTIGEERMSNPFVNG